MKYKNLIFIAIVAFTTLVGSWVIPSLAQKMYANVSWSLMSHQKA